MGIEHILRSISRAAKRSSLNWYDMHWNFYVMRTLLVMWSSFMETVFVCIHVKELFSFAKKKVVRAVPTLNCLDYLEGCCSLSVCSAVCSSHIRAVIYLQKWPLNFSTLNSSSIGSFFATLHFSPCVPEDRFYLRGLIVAFCHLQAKLRVYWLCLLLVRLVR